jgi:hypothetical protein
MFEKLIIYALNFVDQNASILLASIIGSLVSVLTREERSWLAAAASFVSGVFAGWYLSQLAVTWIPIPREPLAAVLAIMGRDLVRHILNMGKNNPMFLLDFVTKMRGGSIPTLPSSTDNKTDGDK